jgi:hypothetical protein
MYDAGSSACVLHLQNNSRTTSRFSHPRSAPATASSAGWLSLSTMPQSHRSRSSVACLPTSNWAYRVTVRRMKNRDLDQVAVIVVLQRDAGANSAEVLDQIVDNIRARQEIRRLITVLTAQGRMAKWIVSLLPVVLLLAITLINPSYMHPMWHETVGHLFLALSAVMVFSGSLVIGRIIDIDV